jgi:hypothetical protein
MIAIAVEAMAMEDEIIVMVERDACGKNLGGIIRLYKHKVTCMLGVVKGTKARGLVSR